MGLGERTSKELFEHRIDSYTEHFVSFINFQLLDGSPVLVRIA
jgi:hypothetical protein